MDNFADWLAQNKDKIEKGVAIIGQTSEVLAATVGQLNPIVEAVFKTATKLLKDPESEDSFYLTQQFQNVNEKLMGIQGELDQIFKVLEKSSLNKQNFRLETHILSQFDKFQDFVNAKPQYKEKKKEKFVRQYENTDRDKNLDDLYNSVTGETLSGPPMLERVVGINKRDRRAVEDFCAQLKKLFVVGIINVMFYTSLTDGCAVEDRKEKWLNRMEDVEKRMKAAVDDCTNNFAQQAKEDMEAHVQENPINISTEVTKALLDLLVKKYDWVRWSIRVIKEKERFFLYNWLAGTTFHGSGGTNCFNVLTRNEIRVVVSFSVILRPIDKVQIQEHLEQKKLKGNMKAVALALHTDFPDCLVDAVSHYKTMDQANNFPEDCYYSGKHRGACLYIHSK